MKRFYELLEDGNFKNQHVAYAWQMIRGHIMGAQSYIQAGHDAKTVLARVAEQVRTQLQELEMYLNGQGTDDKSGVGPDMKPRRPLDKL